MSVTDRLLANADSFATEFPYGHLPRRPELPVAIVTCLDARINTYAIFGLREGEANIVRNAGGIVTDDVIRSLAISQRLLGTREVIVLHHTDCGMLAITDDGFAEQLRADTGVRPPWPVGAFDDVHQDVRRCVQVLESSPFLAGKGSVRGFVYDVHTGKLEEVQPVV